ncbi:pyruvate kinase [Desulfonema ishimotonii]|uniref:Pyruvate kinase n=1 Tax=Desulfonema ishimotonii TaxID=45657 RepID=A0A401FWF5_9BACT|nr:pyruvate kinase [Desulfonema ishimotonii]GBC61283.1 pyruvate kinase [Desulfonema ishimotonii]
MPKTKIVCTIGPSSSSPEIIRELITSGMDVARLNFSHGSHAEHREKIRIIRDISEALARPVAILQDLCGPKIRVGEIPEPGIRLEPGETLTLTSEPVMGSRNRVSVSYLSLPGEVNVGDTILLADGMMELVVEETGETEIRCRVITGGILKSHKGINLPTGTIGTAAITEKDRADLIFGLENDVDYVALSFVRTADDILELKEIIKAADRDTPVIAKIEKHEALDHVDDIMSACDGIMVARGDLGVEIPLEKVPGIQKMLVRKANEKGKPVIIATQMLRSMVSAPRPTRAEATDVANAVLDGADAIMLSEETASGNFPVEAVRFMAKIAKNAEEDFPHQRYLKLHAKKEIPESVAHASCVLADQLEARAIVATTRSGFTAMQISRFRPKPKLIAFSPEKSTIRKLTLYWGCIPRFVAETQNTDERIEKASVAALGTGKVSAGDVIVITTGHPVWAAGTTNMVRVKQL